MYDIEVAWRINDFCNFKCSYCFQPGSKRHLSVGTGNIKTVIDGFKNSGMSWLIHISGGEPFFYPHFTELCLELTRTHYISINSNLSHKNIIHFSEVVDPSRVAFINCSLHIEERERLGLVDDFIEKYSILRNRKFNVFTTYVLHPNLIKRFENDFALFKSHGIVLRPKMFRGKVPYRLLRYFKFLANYFEKNYPEDYTPGERQLISMYSDYADNDDSSLADLNNTSEIRGNISIDVSIDKYFLDGVPNFKGMVCRAGSKFVHLRPNGDVRRCISDSLSLGNLFENRMELLQKPLPCTVNKCGCYYFGYKYLLEHALKHPVSGG